MVASKVFKLMFLGTMLISCNLFANTQPTTPTSPAPTSTPQVPTLSPPIQIDPRLQAALPALKVVTIPLRLPPSIDDFPKGPTDNLYVTVVLARSDHYDLAITLQPDCPAHVCTQGHLTGQRVTTTTPAGTPITLANNVIGYYAAPVCGANCSDGQISWIENGILYSVTMRGDNVSLLTKVANAILGLAPVNSSS